MLKRVYLEITNCCNLRCSFCPGTKRSPRYMSSEQFEQCLQKLKGYTNYLYFHVLGEPLLHPELENFLSIAGRQNYRVCLTTNGTLLFRHPSLAASPALHKVSISLHCYEANCLELSLESYLDQVWNFAEQASKTGILCSLRLWNEGGANQQNGKIIRYLSQKANKDILQLPRDKRGNISITDHLFLEKAEKFDWPSLSAEESGSQYCHALRQQIAVLCDGTVVPCCLDGEGTISLGNLFNQALEEILSSSRVQKMREGFEKRSPSEDLCRHCGYAVRFNK